VFRRHAVTQNLPTYLFIYAKVSDVNKTSCTFKAKTKIREHKTKTDLINKTVITVYLQGLEYVQSYNNNIH